MTSALTAPSPSSEFPRAQVWAARFLHTPTLSMVSGIWAGMGQTTDELMVSVYEISKCLQNADEAVCAGLNVVVVVTSMDQNFCLQEFMF